MEAPPTSLLERLYELAPNNFADVIDLLEKWNLLFLVRELAVWRSVQRGRRGARV